MAQQVLRDIVLSACLVWALYFLIGSGMSGWPLASLVGFYACLTAALPLHSPGVQYPIAMLRLRPPKPFDNPIAIAGEWHGDSNDDCCQQDHFKVIPTGRMRSLRGENPCAGDAAERRRRRENPKRHRADTKQITDTIFRKAGNEIDDEAQDRSFRFDNEPEFVPYLWTHHALNVMRSKPSPHTERYERTHREANRRVDESDRLTKEIAAEKAGCLSGNRAMMTCNACSAMNT